MDDNQPIEYMNILFISKMMAEGEIDKAIQFLEELECCQGI